MNNSQTQIETAKFMLQTNHFNCCRGIRAASVALALAVSAIAVTTGNASAAALLFNDFSSLNGLQLNGATSTIHSCANIANNGGTCSSVTDLHNHEVLRLTNNLGQSGSAFSTNTISLDLNASFSTAFQFHFTDQQNTGADGIVFVVQTVSNTSGGGGGGIGYKGLSNSVGIEFDNWNNGSIDGYSANHVGIDINGDMNSVARNTTIPSLDGPNSIFTAWVDYNGVTDLLEVRTNTTGIRPLTPLLTYTVDLVSVLGQTDAFVGFTSGTGAAAADHDIVSWQFNSTFDPIIIIGTVPEPATLALLGLGLAGIGFNGRRKTAKLS